MSSPKRAAKAAGRTTNSAAKTARRPAPMRPSAKPRVELVDGVSADAKRLAEAIERGIVDGRLDLLSTEALQKLMAAACRVYAARLDAGDQIMPVAKNSISATDVMVTASGLLKAADLAVFELGMWQSWTGR